MTERTPNTANSNLADDALDRLLDAHLAESIELAPSSGFVASVMESIHAQATEPPPIAFPWRRVLPGAIAILCGLLAFVVFAVHEASTAPRGAPPVAEPSTTALWRHLSLALAFTPREITLCWILLAACLSFATVAASFRITGRSE
jgi:hypothetical protein